MNNQEFIEFKRFLNIDDAQTIIDILEKNKIPFKLEKTTPVFDPTFASRFESDFMILKLNPKYFQNAEKAIVDNQNMDLQDLDPEYYLFKFTKQELIDVIVNIDEWNETDRQYAKIMLAQRGEEVSESFIKENQNNRLKKLSEPERPPRYLILLGYLFAILGGLLGIYLGAQLHFTSKLLPDGTKVKAYDKSAVEHGFIIMLIGIFTFLSGVFSFLIKL